MKVTRPRCILLGSTTRLVMTMAIPLIPRFQPGQLDPVKPGYYSTARVTNADPTSLRSQIGTLPTTWIVPCYTHAKGMKNPRGYLTEGAIKHIRKVAK